MCSLRAKKKRGEKIKKTVVKGIIVDKVYTGCCDGLSSVRSRKKKKGKQGEDERDKLYYRSLVNRRK